jgi:hypothetical protein
MKFREWLDKIEEAGGGTKFTASSSSNTDRSALYGLSAQYGHRGTQVPISWGLNNKGTASLIAGIGSGIGASLDSSGFSATPPPNITPFPNMKEQLVRNYSLPLQLPYLEGSDRPVVNTSNSRRSLFLKLGQIIQDKDPLKDPRARKMGDSGNEAGKFKTPDPSDYTQIEQAKDFTRGLVHMVIANKLFEEGMINKYDLQNPSVEAEDVRDGIFICAMSFKRLNDIPDNIGNEGGA